ncbi:MAG: ribosome modulation factor [Venatoribacter sp.]
MRKQKRDMQERAFSRGYRAGVERRSKDLAPTGETPQRDAWLAGWRSGRSDHWDGYIGVSGIHKMATI